MKTKTALALEFSKKFPELNSEDLQKFYLTPKSKRVTSKNSVSFSIKWYKDFNYDLSMLDCKTLLYHHTERVLRLERLEYENKHPSVIDISLYEIYSINKEDAKNLYSCMVKQKTLNITSNNDKYRFNPDKTALILRYGEEDGIRRYNNFVEKQKLISSMSLLYWINLGYSEENAKIKQAERQATFSYKKLVEEHGEIIGYSIWKERQEKWQDTLNSKSDEEKKLINKKKGHYSLEAYLLRGFSIDEANELLNIALKKFSSTFSKEAILFIEDNFSLVDAKYGNSEWYLVDDKTKRRYWYDYSNINLGIIFEYHGHAFHPNKSVLSKKDWDLWRHPFSKETADEVHKYDTDKRKTAEDHGFKFFCVYSNDSEETKIKVVKEMQSILTN